MLFVLLVVGGAATAWLMLRSDDPGVFASPEHVELPEAPEDHGLTRAYLDTDAGSRVPRYVEAVKPVLQGEPSQASCRRVARSLDRIGTPDQVFASAAGIPDPDTAEMAVNHLSAMSRFLGHCIEDAGVPAREEVRFTDAILRRRLEQLP